jgi:hypothetical protein
MFYVYMSDVNANMWNCNRIFKPFNYYSVSFLVPWFFKFMLIFWWPRECLLGWKCLFSLIVLQDIGFVYSRSCFHSRGLVFGFIYTCSTWYVELVLHICVLFYVVVWPSFWRFDWMSSSKLKVQLFCSMMTINSQIYFNKFMKFMQELSGGTHNKLSRHNMNL